MARGRAERVKARNRFAAAGFGQRAHVAADELLKQQAVRKILDRPGAELALSVPALWRGGLLQAAIFACVLVYAWYRRRADLLAFCLPAVGLTLFYALFSVFEPRYGVPMIPVALLAAAIALSAARLPARLFRSTGATGHTARRWPKFRWRSAAP